MKQLWFFSLCTRGLGPVEMSYTGSPMGAEGPVNGGVTTIYWEAVRPMQMYSLVTADVCLTHSRRETLEFMLIWMQTHSLETATRPLLVSLTSLISIYMYSPNPQSISWLWLGVITNKSQDSDDNRACSITCCNSTLGEMQFGNIFLWIV